MQGGAIPCAMKAKCAYFGKCSGCTLQQFPYVKQLADKTRRVRSELAPLLPNSVSPEMIQSTIPSPSEHAYRSSGKLCLHEDELGRRSIGLYERGSKKVVDIPQCSVHHPEINRLVEKLFSFGKKLPAKLYQHNKKGFQADRLKFIVIRYCPDTREFGLVISHTGVDQAALKAWAEGLRLSNVSFYEALLTAEDDDLVMARNVNHLAGPKTFRFRIGSRDFQIDPIAFFQANSSLINSFVETIAAPHQGDVLVDLYGGFGTYSFQAAERFRKVVVVEANPHSIESANELIKRESIANVQTLASSVEDYLKTVLKKPEAKEVTDIIVNPPRSGLSRYVVDSLQAKAFEKLQRITYVSCDLTTLKRDLRELTRSGQFIIENAIPFDMFPQTDHIENVVRIVKNPKARVPSGPQPKPTSAAISQRPPLAKAKVGAGPRLNPKVQPKAKPLRAR
ncbi:MAG: 23S rRNA (uracil(1939)-C(5))-methyltransferase RlmD [Proteobacteria bacterium]|nr:MAG: 23S rRNA (uracil(1939)-C(5))-methyltransferase RlmD [Pseudomonadota bacterium]